MPEDLKYGTVTLERRRIPDDEGVIVFRFRDAMLPGALERYRDDCERAGSPAHHLELIDRNISAVRHWQAEHPDLVVTPTSTALLTPSRSVGDPIRWCSGGSVREGRIVEVLDHGHVKVDTWPAVIPPAWIVDDEPAGEGIPYG